MRFIISAKAKRWLALSFVVTAVIVVLICVSSAGNGDVPASAFSTISHIDTPAPIYTVIAVTENKTNAETLEIFAGICVGFGIEPTVFTSTDSIGRTDGVLSEVDGFSYEYGLLCENTEKMSRSAFMKYLALGNDEFYRVCGKHSACVYINGANSPYASEVMASYGQYGMTYSVFSGKSDSVRNGDIIAVDISDKNSVYGLVDLLSRAAKNGLECVPMKEYIREYESIAES